MRLLFLATLVIGCNEQGLTYEKLGEPGILVSPTSLDFSAAGSQTVTVSSTGEAQLVVSSVGMRSAGAFAVTAADGLPGVLDPGTSGDVVVSWAPGAETTGWLDIVSNDPITPLATVSLAGTFDDTGHDTGDDTSVPLSAAMLDPLDAHLEARLGETDSTTFTLTNTGETVLSIGASVSGPGFLLTSSVPPTLDVGASLVLDLDFTPTTVGDVVGSLDVAIVDLPTLSATLSGTGLAAPPAPTTFTWTGLAQTYTVPSGDHSVTLEAWGAGGGAGSFTGAYAGAGGGGGYATTTVSVTPGDVLTIRPGQGGHQPGGGGGGSFVWDASGTLLLVAGGGGGGGTDGGSPLSGSGAGGAGGGATGATGSTQFDAYWGSAAGGTGGSATAGGVGGNATLGAASGPGCQGEAGRSQAGGGGATGSSSCGYGTGAILDSAGLGGSNGSGGGGGSGWYGGAGGASVYTYFGGGGGGGSSAAPAGTLESGTGRAPGGTSSGSWDGNAGTGGLAGTWPTTPSTDGTTGLVVVH